MPQEVQADGHKTKTRYRSESQSVLDKNALTLFCLHKTQIVTPFPDMPLWKFIKYVFLPKVWV